ncbi:MAG TPA: family 1 glycosylhydrolase [Rhabdochlamydiaceae bacterium]|jgi:beta-glucosidase|nr:family 1 glycosylhydrolase [Rhabdochlamydiaceae bacterium]
MVQACNNAVWSAFENCLIPPAASTSWYYSTLLKKSVGAVCLFPVGVVTGGLVGIQKVASYAASFVTKQKYIDPKENFQAVLDNSKLWSKIGTDKEIKKELVENRSGGAEPKKIGIGTCMFQDSGLYCPDSQWAVNEWQMKCIKDPTNRSGPNSHLFELYKTPKGRQQVIDRLNKLNVNTFRLSIEWSHVQPKQGEWNEANLQVYVDFCRELRKAGIGIWITLLHFSEPKWFHDLGSFEKEANIEYFAGFAERVFDRLTEDYGGRPLVEYFCTINEPAIDAFSRYVLGSFSPGFFLRFARAGNFLLNALKTHCIVYDRLKKRNPSVQIGIIHQYLEFIPTNFLLIPVVRYFTRLINETPLKFFETGKFELKVPFLCNIEEQLPMPWKDFVGLQYYTRAVIGLAGPTSYHEPMTQMPFREDPEGIYRAITRTYEAFKCPVMVTETGISTHNDEQRNRYWIRVMYAARAAGRVIGMHNFLGVIGWCLGDNLELNMGVRPQAFGAYALTDKGLAENPKPGMESFIKVAAAWKSRSEQQQQKVA